MIYFLGSILYSVLILLSLKYFHYSNYLLYWIIGMLIVKPLYKSSPIFTESAILLLLWLLFKDKGEQNTVFLYLPLITTVLILIHHKMQSIFFTIFSILITIIWFIMVNETPLRDLNSFQIFIFSTTTLGLVIHTLDNVRNKKTIPKKVDVILCSYSGNTAHYTNKFIEGLKTGGAEVIVHRFHNPKEFNPNLTGDTLIVSFPVSGWKPPWPLVAYLLKKLPKGNGKPVFIIYTAAGGPENAGIVAWFLLKTKGYKVVGRYWAIYPLNVPTFRIGPERLWNFFDKLVPVKKDIETIKKVGEKLAQGKRTGLPFVLWPFPLSVVGFLLDNKFVNIFLYRNRAWRRRCVKCGMCLKYCPAERLYIKDGFPKAKGTCHLCLGCINFCPKNAMQMIAFTEYGNRYKPRWPELVAGGMNKS